MKTHTLLLEMRCNNFCFFCGNRAVDGPMVRTRERLGLSIPKADRSLDYGALPTAESGLEEKRYTLPSALDELQNAAQEGYTSLSLQGGEPSLWPWVVELCQEADALGFKEIQMVTNGQRFSDRDFSEKIIAAKLSALVFSLLGKDAETHDGQTLVPGSFEKMVAGIKNCVEIAEQLDSPIKITGTVVVSRRNYEQLPEIIDLMAATGLRGANLHLIRFDLFGDDPKVREWMSFPVEDAVPSIEEAHRRAQRQGLTLHVDSLPMCLFPSIRSFALKAWHRRHVSKTHKFSAASFGYTHGEKNSFWHDNKVSSRERKRSSLKALVATAAAPFLKKRSDATEDEGRRPQHGPDNASHKHEDPTFEPCHSCILEQGCTKVPMDHLDPSRPTPLSPVSLQSFINDLERIPERVQDSDNRLHDWTNTLQTIRESKILSDSEQRLLHSSFRKACLNAFNNAVRNGEPIQARKLSRRVEGLHPTSTLSPDFNQQSPRGLSRAGYPASGTLRRRVALKLLERIEEHLGVGPVGREFLLSMESAEEDFELGVGLSLSREDDALGALFSYNPRRREGDFRDRITRLLTDLGMDPAAEAARKCFELLPAERCSTVFGLEWERGSAHPSATLYLEELGQLRRPSVNEVTEELRALVGVECSVEWPAQGRPYILALDLDSSGASALKLYRSVPQSAASEVRADLGTTEPTEQRLTGLLCGDLAPGSWPREGDGFMVQQRYTAAAAGPTKVYRTFPYQASGLPLQPADRLIQHVAEEFGGRRSLAALEALNPALGDEGRALYPTSVGVSFDPELGSARYGTAYWEVLRPGRS